jgi:hypothetical protein
MLSRKKFASLALAFTLLAGSGGVFAAQQLEYEEISTEMAEIRGLELLEPLDIATQNRAELREWLIETIDTDYPEEDQERDQTVMVLFGLIEPGTDLGDLEIDLLGEQVAGYYDSETNEMVVVTSGNEEGSGSASDEITFAHETVHALQDQHFDLVALQDEAKVETDDEYLAISALIEGDATIGQVQYMAEHPGLLLQLQRELEGLDSTILDSAPPFIVSTLLFPYDEGATFVTALYDEGGWDLVNQAYANPPQSTEQILHPEKYLEGEAPIEVAVNDPLPALSPGWEILEVNTFGEYMTGLFLDSGEIRPSTALEAAEGWGGDEYVVAAREDGTALVWSTEWDTEEDAEEFFTVLSTHEIKRYDAEAAEGTDGSVTQFASDNFAGEIRREGTNVTYFLAYDEATVQELLENQQGEGEPAVDPSASPDATPAATYNQP